MTMPNKHTNEEIDNALAHIAHAKDVDEDYAEIFSSEIEVIQAALIAYKAPQTQTDAMAAFQRVLDDMNHGIYGNRTVEHHEADVERVKKALINKPTMTMGTHEYS